MNKRIAALLFAVGIGAASAPAMATCFECHREYQACIASGEAVEVCIDGQVMCNDRCGL